MNNPDKNKGLALAATVIFHVAVLLILVLSYLHYKDIPADDDMVKQDITFFGGEYVMLGGNVLPQSDDLQAASSAQADEQANTGDNADDAGVEGESATPALSSRTCRAGTHTPQARGRASHRQACARCF